LGAAAVLRRAGNLGVLAEGASADLIAVKSDPLAQITALREIELVISRGRLEKTP
jgi:imidazolonepropionase-like amidohydrolase